MLWLVIANEAYYPSFGTDDWIYLGSDEDKARGEYARAEGDTGTLVRLDLYLDETGVETSAPTYETVMSR